MAIFVPEATREVVQTFPPITTSSPTTASAPRRVAPEARAACFYYLPRKGACIDKAQQA